MSETVIKCESVYKIFGENAKKMLEESNGNVDAKTFQEKGCIVGVNNASFEVAKGEMLVVMGLYQELIFQFKMGQMINMCNFMLIQFLVPYLLLVKWAMVNMDQKRAFVFP